MWEWSTALSNLAACHLVCVGILSSVKMVLMLKKREILVTCACLFYIICNLLFRTGCVAALTWSSSTGSDGDDIEACIGGFLGRLGLVTLIPGVACSSTFSYSKIGYSQQSLKNDWYMYKFIFLLGTFYNTCVIL